MNEMKRWDDEKPGSGRFINLYRPNSDHAVFCRVVQNGFFRGIEGSQVGDWSIPQGDAVWCYVPVPPNWDAIQKRVKAEAVNRSIAHHKYELERLEVESEELAAEIE